MSIEALRTPDEAFESLPDWPYAPHYLDDLPGFDGLRVAYVDEGHSGAHVYLCLHGEPTWSYLYRKMIPFFLATGARVVAPDFFGFGRSDKPVDEGTYTFSFHRTMLLRFVERLKLRDVTLVAQDWGGLLGLTLPVDAPLLIARLFLMNTALGTGDGPIGPGFLRWRDFSNAHPDLAAGRLIARGTPQLTDAEAAAYDAPFPDVRYKAGVRAFPNLVPITPDMDGAAVSRRARTWLQTGWDGPTVMVVGMADPVIGGPGMDRLRSCIRNCPLPIALETGGHFVQEWSEQFTAQAIAALTS